MAEYHFPVPGSIDEGKIVLFVRRHWASFLGQFLLSFFMLVLPTVIFIIIYLSNPHFYEGIARNFIVLALSIYYLIAITVAFIAWISFYYDIYIICDDRIVDIIQQGFFGRKISQLSLLRVQDVTSNIEGLIPTFFGFGDVLVETAGEQSQNFLLKAVPNPQEVSAKIMELHNQIIETEGRHHQVLEGEGALSPGKNQPESGEPPSANESSPPVAPPESPPSPNQPTTYQELLKKEQQGQISHDDLDKGGEIDLN